MLLPLWAGCASAPLLDSQGQERPPAELCNTPGRKAFSHAIVEHGGLVLVEGKQWDNSVEASIKREMGPPLAFVVMPTDRFSDQLVAEVQGRLSRSPRDRSPHAGRFPVRSGGLPGIERERRRPPVARVSRSGPDWPSLPFLQRPVGSARRLAKKLANRVDIFRGKFYDAPMYVDPT